MKFLRIFSLIVIFSVFNTPSAFAQDDKSFLRGVFEFFYPSLRVEPEDPTDSLQAPFATEEQSDAPLAFTPEEEEAVAALDAPHRLSSDIGKWLTVVLSEAMTFASDDYKTDLEKTASYFDENGRALYLRFLEENKMIKILESEQYFMRSFVQDAPLLLNEGVVGDHYRWLFEIPVVVSYMDRTLTDYAKGDATTQVMELQVQIARSAEAGEFGVVIDQWAGKGGKIIKSEK